MARFVSDNPKSSRSLTITPSGITVSGTAASGTVGTSTSASSLQKGQSVILVFTGGSAGGFVSAAEYFAIPVASGSFQIASTHANAMNGIPLTSASGNAGAGVAYPVYGLGGTVYFGTGGDALVRGLGVSDTGLSSFCLHKNIADGAVYPFMLKDIVMTSGSTVSDLVCWSD